MGVHCPKDFRVGKDFRPSLLERIVSKKLVFLANYINFKLLVKIKCILMVEIIILNSARASQEGKRS